MKDLDRPGFSKKLRASAFMTLVCFLCTQVTWAAPASSAAPEIRYSSLAEKILIPEMLGRIEERSVPKTPSRLDPPTIIQIQDAHSSYDAQKKIRDLLRHLEKEYDFKLILAEGGAGKLSTRPLQYFQDPKHNQELAGRLAEKSEIGGIELYLLDPSTQKTSAYGLEDETLYWQNLLDYRAVISEEETSRRFFEKAKEKFDQIASRTFQPVLRRFLKEWTLYQDSPEQMFERFEILSKTAQQETGLDLLDSMNQLDWPSLVRFARVKKLEKDIDPAKVKTEKEKLDRWLRSHVVLSGAKELGAEILLQKTPSRQLLEKFYEKAGPHGFRFKDYPALFDDFSRRVLQSEIDPMRLMQEFEKLTNAILDKLAQTAEEKSLVAWWKEFRLNEKLFALELSRDDFEKVSARRAELRPSVSIERLLCIGKNCPNGAEGQFFSNVDKIFEDALRFYEGALKRDAAMVQNLTRLMKETGQSKAVMVTGGFHSRGILDSLKNQNLAFVQVSPHISELEKGTAYHDVMMSFIKSPLYLAAINPSSGPPAIQTLKNTFSAAHARRLREAAEELGYPAKSELRSQILILAKPSAADAQKILQTGEEHFAGIDPDLFSYYSEKLVEKKYFAKNLKHPVEIRPVIYGGSSKVTVLLDPVFADLTPDEHLRFKALLSLELQYWTNLAKHLKERHKTEADNEAREAAYSAAAKSLDPVSRNALRDFALEWDKKVQTPGFVDFLNQLDAAAKKADLVPAASVPPMIAEAKGSLSWPEGKWKPTLDLNQSANRVAFSKDGTRILTAAGGIVQILNAKTKSLQGNFFIGEVRAIAFSPDDQEIVTAQEDGSLRIWNALTGQEKQKFTEKTENVTAIDVARNGRILTAKNGFVKIWDTSGAEWGRLDMPGEKIVSAVFTNRGSVLIASEKQVYLWDTLRGEKSVFKTYQDNQLLSVSFIEKANQVVTIQRNGQMNVWSYPDGREVADLRLPSGWIMSAAFSEDHRQAAVATTTGKLMSWEFVSSEMRSELRVSPPLDLLGASLHPTPEEHILVQAQPPLAERLANAVILLESFSKELFDVYQAQVKGNYFAKMMPAGAALKVFGVSQKLSFLANFEYSTSPSKKELDHLLLLHLAGAALKLKAIGGQPLAAIDVNAQLAAFMLQAWIYRQFLEADRAALKKLAQEFDAHWKEARLVPAFDFFETLPEEFKIQEHKKAFSKFLASVGLEPGAYDFAKAEATAKPFFKFTAKPLMAAPLKPEQLGALKVVPRSYNQSMEYWTKLSAPAAASLLSIQVDSKQGVVTLEDVGKPKERVRIFYEKSGFIARVAYEKLVPATKNWAEYPHPFDLAEYRAKGLVGAGDTPLIEVGFLNAIEYEIILIVKSPAALEKLKKYNEKVSLPPFIKMVSSEELLENYQRYRKIFNLEILAQRTRRMLLKSIREGDAARIGNLMNLFRHSGGEYNFSNLETVFGPKLTSVKDAAPGTPLLAIPSEADREIAAGFVEKILEPAETEDIDIMTAVSPAQGVALLQNGVFVSPGLSPVFKVVKDDELAPKTADSSGSLAALAPEPARGVKEAFDSLKAPWVRAQPNQVKFQWRNGLFSSFNSWNSHEAEITYHMKGHALHWTFHLRKPGAEKTFLQVSVKKDDRGWHWTILVPQTNNPRHEVGFLAGPPVLDFKSDKKGIRFIISTEAFLSMDKFLGNLKAFDSGKVPIRFVSAAEESRRRSEMRSGSVQDLVPGMLGWDKSLNESKVWFKKSFENSQYEKKYFELKRVLGERGLDFLPEKMPKGYFAAGLPGYGTIAKFAGDDVLLLDERLLEKPQEIEQETWDLLLGLVLAEPAHVFEKKKAGTGIPDENYRLGFVWAVWSEFVKRAGLETMEGLLKAAAVLDAKKQAGKHSGMLESWLKSFESFDGFFAKAGVEKDPKSFSQGTRAVLRQTFSAPAAEPSSEELWSLGNTTYLDWKEAFFLAHPDEVKSAVFSPDGKTILTASNDSMVRLWDASSGAELKQLPLQGAMAALFSPNGQQILGVGFKVLLWDTRDLTKAPFEFDKNIVVHHIFFSQDGDKIGIIGQEGFRKIFIYDNRGPLPQLLNVGKLDSEVSQAVFSTDGKRVLAFSKSVKGPWILNGETGEQLAYVGAGRENLTFGDFSKDGRWLLTNTVEGEKKGIRILWADSLEPEKVIEGRIDSILKGYFAQDEKFAITLDKDGSVKVWDLVKEKTVFTLWTNIGHGVLLGLSKDQKTILTNGPNNKTVSVWKYEKSKPLRSEVRMTEAQIQKHAAYEPVVQYYAAQELTFEALRRGDAAQYKAGLNGMIRQARDALSKAKKSEVVVEIARYLKDKKILSHQYAKIFDEAEILSVHNDAFRSWEEAIVEKETKSFLDALGYPSDLRGDLERQIKLITYPLSLLKLMPASIASFQYDEKALPLFMQQLLSFKTAKGMLRVTPVLEEDLAILVRPSRDSFEFKATYFHEIVHYLALRNYLPFDVSNEMVTQAMSAVVYLQEDKWTDFMKLIDPADMTAELYEFFKKTGETDAVSKHALPLPAEVQQWVEEHLAKRTDISKFDAETKRDQVERLSGIYLAGYAYGLKHADPKLNLMRYVVNYGKRHLPRVRNADYIRKLTARDWTLIHQTVSTLRAVALVTLHTVDERLHFVPRTMRDLKSLAQNTRWFYEEAARTMRYFPWDIIEYGPEASVGLTLQEVFRANFSEEGLIEPAYDNVPFRLLYGVSETARVVAQGLGEYPGRVKEIETFYRKKLRIFDPQMEKERMAEKPLFVQYIEALFYTMAMTKKVEKPAMDPRVTHKEVRAAIKATFPDLLSVIGENGQTFYETVRDKVWPEVEKLLKKDEENKIKEELETETLNKMIEDGEFEITTDPAPPGGGEGQPQPPPKPGEKIKISISPAAGGKAKPMDLSEEARKKLDEAIRKKMDEMSEAEREALKKRAEESLEKEIKEEAGNMSDITSDASGKPGGKGKSQGKPGKGEGKGVAGKSSKELQKALKELGGLADDIGKQAEKIEAKAEAAADAANKVDKRAGKIDRAGEAGASEEEDLEKGIEALVEKIKELRAKAQEFNEAAGEIQNQADELEEEEKNSRKEAIDDLIDRAAGLGEMAEKVAEDAAEAHQIADEAGKSADEISGKPGEDQPTTEAVKGRASLIQEKMKKVKQKLEEVVKKTQEAGDETHMMQEEADLLEKALPDVSERGEENDPSGAPGDPGFHVQVGKKKKTKTTAEADPAKPSPSADSGSPRKPKHHYNPEVMKKLKEFLKEENPEAEEDSDTEDDLQSKAVQDYTGLEDWQRIVMDQIRSLAEPYEVTLRENILNALEDLKPAERLRRQNRGRLDGRGLAAAKSGVQNIFTRRNEPGEKKLRLSLLLDVSYSMFSDDNKFNFADARVRERLTESELKAKNRINNAIKTAVLYMYAFRDTEEVELEIGLFADSPKIILPFGTPITEAKIFQIAYTIFHHGLGSNNSDLAGLRKMVQSLQRRDQEEGPAPKILTIIADGGIDYRDKEGIQEILENTKDIVFLPVGIGPSSADVEKAYEPYGRVVSNVSKLAEKVGEWIQEQSMRLLQEGERSEMRAAKKDREFIGVFGEKIEENAKPVLFKASFDRNWLDEIKKELPGGGLAKDFEAFVKAFDAGNLKGMFADNLPSAAGMMESRGKLFVVLPSFLKEKPAGTKNYVWKIMAAFLIVEAAGMLNESTGKFSARSAEKMNKLKAAGRGDLEAFLKLAGEVDKVVGGKKLTAFLKQNLQLSPKPAAPIKVVRAIPRINMIRKILESALSRDEKKKRLKLLSNSFLRSEMRVVAARSASSPRNETQHFAVIKEGSSEYLVLKDGSDPDFKIKINGTGIHIPDIRIFETDTNVKNIIEIIKAAADQYLNRSPIYLIGEAGTGKNTLAYYAAKLLRKNIRFVAMHNEMTPDDLVVRRGVGEKEKDKTDWIPSAIVEAMKHGDWVILDEVGKLDSKVRSALNQIIQSRRVELPDGTVVKADDGFAIIETNNVLAGSNDEKVYELKPDSAEILDRRIAIYIDYLPKGEEKEVLNWELMEARGYKDPAEIPAADTAWIDSLVDLANNLRELYKGIDTKTKKSIGRGKLVARPLSTRALVKIIKQAALLPSERERTWSLIRKYYAYQWGRPDQIKNVEEAIANTFTKADADKKYALTVEDKKGPKYDTNKDGKRILKFAGIEVELGKLAPAKMEDLPLDMQVIWTEDNLQVLREMLIDIKLKNSILMIGDAGTGKDTIAEYVSTLIYGKEETYTVNGDTSYEDLIAFLGLGEGERYKEGKLVEAAKGETALVPSYVVRGMRGGYPIVLSEINKGKPAALSSLNNPLQFRWIDLANGYRQPAEDGWMIIGTMNLDKPGKKMYLGNYKLSGEFVDRFSVYAMKRLEKDQEIDMLMKFNDYLMKRDPAFKKLKRDFIAKLVDYEETLVKRYNENKLGRPVSMRGVKRMIVRFARYPKDKDKIAVNAGGTPLANQFFIFHDPVHQKIVADEAADAKFEEMKSIIDIVMSTGDAEMDAALETLRRSKPDAGEVLRNLVSLEALVLKKKKNKDLLSKALSLFRAINAEVKHDTPLLGNVWLQIDARLSDPDQPALVQLPNIQDEVELTGRHDIRKAHHWLLRALSKDLKGLAYVPDQKEEVSVLKLGTPALYLAVKKSNGDPMLREILKWADRHYDFSLSAILKLTAAEDRVEKIKEMAGYFGGNPTFTGTVQVTVQNGLKDIEYKKNTSAAEIKIPKNTGPLKLLHFLKSHPELLDKAEKETVDKLLAAFSAMPALSFEDGGLKDAVMSLSEAWTDADVSLQNMDALTSLISQGASRKDLRTLETFFGWLAENDLFSDDVRKLAAKSKSSAAPKSEVRTEGIMAGSIGLDSGIKRPVLWKTSFETAGFGAVYSAARQAISIISPELSFLFPMKMLKGYFANLPSYSALQKKKDEDLVLLDERLMKKPEDVPDEIWNLLIGILLTEILTYRDAREKLNAQDPAFFLDMSRQVAGKILKALDDEKKGQVMALAARLDAAAQDSQNKKYSTQLRVWLETESNQKTEVILEAKPAEPETKGEWQAGPAISLEKHSGTDGKELSAQFSANGKYLVTQGRSEFLIWEAAAGKLRMGHQGHSSIRFFEISPDRRRFLSFGNRFAKDQTQNMRIWDFDHLESPKVLEGIIPKSGMDPFFSEDGKWIVVVSYEEGVGNILHILDAATGQSIARLPQEEKTDILKAKDVMTTSGRRVITFNSRKEKFFITLWDPAQQTPVHVFEEFSEQVKDSVISEDGSKLITYHGKQSAIVWDLANGTKLRENPAGPGTKPLYLSKNGKIALWGDRDGSSTLYDTETQKSISQPRVPVKRSPDGSLFGFMDRDGKFSTFNPETGEKTSFEVPSSIHRWEFTNDSTGILTFHRVSSEGDSLILWDAKTGNEVRKFLDKVKDEEASDLDGMALSEDGRRLIVEYARYWLMWDIATGKLLLEKSKKAEGKRYSLGPWFWKDGKNLYTIDKASDYQHSEAGFEVSKVALTILDGDSGEPLQRIPLEIPSPHDIQISFDQESQQAFLLPRHYKTLQLLKFHKKALSMPAGAESWASAASFSVPSDWKDVYFSKSGDYSIAEGKNSFSIWDVRTGKLELGGQKNSFLRMSPDRSRFLTVSVKGEKGKRKAEVWVWNFQNLQKPLHLFDFTNDYWQLFDDSSTAVSEAAGMIRDQQLLFSEDGKWVLGFGDLIADKNTVKIWDAETGTVVNTLTDGVAIYKAAAIQTHFGPRLLSFHVDNHIQMWDPEKPELMETLALPWRAKDFMLSEDETKIVLSEHSEGAFKYSVWDLEKGEFLGQGKRSGFMHKTTFLSNSGKVARFGNESKEPNAIWDEWVYIPNGAEIGMSKPYGGEWFAADKTVFLAKTENNQYEVIEAETGKTVTTLQNAEGISAALFTKNSDLVIAYSYENDTITTLKGWSAMTGTEALTFLENYSPKDDAAGDFNGIEISKDGRYLLLSFSNLWFVWDFVGMGPAKKIRKEKAGVELSQGPFFWQGGPELYTLENVHDYEHSDAGLKTTKAVLAIYDVNGSRLRQYVLPGADVKDILLNHNESGEKFSAFNKATLQMQVFEKSKKEITVPAEPAAVPESDPGPLNPEDAKKRVKEILAQNKITEKPTTFAIRPDGKIIAITGAGDLLYGPSSYGVESIQHRIKVRFFDLQTGKYLSDAVLLSRNASVWKMVFSQDGDFLVWPYEDQSLRVLDLFDIKHPMEIVVLNEFKGAVHGQEIEKRKDIYEKSLKKNVLRILEKKIGKEPAIAARASSPDGEYLAVATERNVYLFRRYLDFGYTAKEIQPDDLVLEEPALGTLKIKEIGFSKNESLLEVTRENGVMIKTRLPRSEVRRETVIDVAREVFYQILDNGLLEKLSREAQEALLRQVMPEKQAAQVEVPFALKVFGGDKQFGVSIVPAEKYEETDLRAAQILLQNFPHKLQVVAVKSISDELLAKLNKLSEKILQGRVLIVRENEEGYGATLEALFRGDRKVFSALPKFVSIANVLAAKAGTGRFLKLPEIMQFTSAVLPEEEKSGFTFQGFIKAELLKSEILRQKAPQDDKGMAYASSALSIITAGLSGLDSRYLTPELLSNLKDIQSTGPERFRAVLAPQSAFLTALTHLRQAAQALASAA